MLPFVFYWIAIPFDDESGFLRIMAGVGGFFMAFVLLLWGALIGTVEQVKDAGGSKQTGWRKIVHYQLVQAGLVLLIGYIVYKVISSLQ